MWSLFLCLLTLNYCDAKLQLASKSSASKNKDWTIWIKKIESQKGIYFRLGKWFLVGYEIYLVPRVAKFTSIAYSPLFKNGKERWKITKILSQFSLMKNLHSRQKRIDGWVQAQENRINLQKCSTLIAQKRKAKNFAKSISRIQSQLRCNTGVKVCSTKNFIEKKLQRLVLQ